LAAAAEWVEPAPLATFSRDPDDDKLIHAASAAGAQWLVTGDGDLLTLGKVEDVVILTPEQALRQLEGGKSR
jgi:predicted nucleic acid-binding protein